MPQPAEHSAIEDAANASAERALRWCSNHPRVLMGTAAALLVCGMGLWANGRAQMRATERHSVGFAQAMRLADGRLQADVDAQKVLADKLAAEQADRAAKRAAKQALEGNSAAAIADDEQDEQDEQAAREQAADDDDAEAAAAYAEREARRPLFADDKSRAKAAADAFAEVAEQAGRSPLTPLARLEAAAYAQKMGDADKAKAQLRDLYVNMSTHDSLWPVAASRWATLLEEQGDADGAVLVWRRIAAHNVPYLADEAGLQEARILARKGDIEAARTLLQETRLKFPDTALNEEIRAALLDLPAASSKAPAAAATP